MRATDQEVVKNLYERIKEDHEQGAAEAKRILNLPGGLIDFKAREDLSALIVQFPEFKA